MGMNPTVEELLKSAQDNLRISEGENALLKSRNTALKSECVALRNCWNCGVHNVQWGFPPDKHPCKKCRHHIAVANDAESYWIPRLKRVISEKD